MRAIIFISCLVLLVNDAAGQSIDPPVSDTQLSIHTLVREDIFAGWRTNNMARFTRGEKNIDLLLDQRPDSRADLLAWKGGAKLYRAILALEAKKNDEFEKHFQQTKKLFAEARQLGPENVGVAAVCGGSYLTFGDRLPKDLQAAAWADAYKDYQVLWKLQGEAVSQMPVHIRGELLAGLAQSAHRTGRKKEMEKYLDKIIEVLPETGYETMAQKWKKNPQLAATTNISCKTCHAPGRLKKKIAENQKK